MEPLPIWMIRRDLRNIPSCHLPQGYHFRAFRPGDERLWAEVHCSAGQFETIDAALARFHNDFGNFIDEFLTRSLFIVRDEDDAPVASATAWHNEFMGEHQGQVHWVSVVPDHQGQGLGKALLARVLHRLAESHDKAYLKTKDFRHVAIRLYLDFGFEPVLIEPTCPQAWRNLASLLKHPALRRFA